MVKIIQLFIRLHTGTVIVSLSVHIITFKNLHLFIFYFTGLTMWSKCVTSLPNKSALTQWQVDSLQHRAFAWYTTFFLSTVILLKFRMQTFCNLIKFFVLCHNLLFEKWLFLFDFLTLGSLFYFGLKIVPCHKPYLKYRSVHRQIRFKCFCSNCILLYIFLYGVSLLKILLFFKQNKK